MSEQQTNDLIKAFINSHARDRFWRNLRFFLKSFFFVALVLMVLGMVSRGSADHGGIDPTRPYAALVPLQGEVAAGKPFSARSAIPQIKKAFLDKDASAVILYIDSPGGSPANASEIFQEIRRYQRLFPKKPVVAVAGDMLTSAAYLVASAAGEVYVNENTVTGSIGVISSGFGFNKAMEKLGIERRVLTSGVNKSRLDPFSPLSGKDKAKMQQVLASVHRNFIAQVKQGRGDRLRGDKSTLFSGDFWTGKEAVKLGLVDGTKTLGEVLSQLRVSQYRIYRSKPSFLQSVLSGLSEEVSVRLQSKGQRLYAGM